MLHAATEEAGDREALDCSEGAPTPAADDPLTRLAGLRDALAKSVMLTGDRIQEVVDDAVKRGRMTRTDAEDLVQRLISLGRAAGPRMRSRTSSSCSAAAPRRAAIACCATSTARAAPSASATFPILGYDDLTAAPGHRRASSDLTPAQLRKVRDHEKRNANRKSVLQAIERKLPK